MHLGIESSAVLDVHCYVLREHRIEGCSLMQHLLRATHPLEVVKSSLHKAVQDNLCVLQ
jgi:hypothetical protein